MAVLHTPSHQPNPPFIQAQAFCGITSEENDALQDPRAQLFILRHGSSSGNIVITLSIYKTQF